MASPEELIEQIVPAQHRVPLDKKQYRRAMCRALMDHNLDELAVLLKTTPEGILEIIKEKY